MVRYELTLTPDLAGKAVSGFETIVLRTTADGLAALAFSRNALTIDAAAIGGQPIVVALTDSALVFELPRPLAKGDPVTLRLAYHGVPARGVTFGPASAYSSYFACDWMVCAQDTPGDKAEFALDLRLPVGVVSRARGSRPVARGRGPASRSIAGVLRARTRPISSASPSATSSSPSAGTAATVSRT